MCSMPMLMATISLCTSKWLDAHCTLLLLLRLVPVPYVADAVFGHCLLRLGLRMQQYQQSYLLCKYSSNAR